MAKVSVSLGYTRNMQNFESMRVDIGIEDETRAGENVDSAFTRIYGKVETLLIDKVRELEEEIKDTTGR